MNHVNIRSQMSTETHEISRKAKHLPRKLDVKLYLMAICKLHRLSKQEIRKLLIYLKK